MCRDRFAALLSSGNLCETVTFKVSYEHCSQLHPSSLPLLSQCNLTKTGSFYASLNAIINALHLSIVEQSNDSSSLYGCSIAGHHICLLVKSQVCLHFFSPSYLPSILPPLFFSLSSLFPPLPLPPLSLSQGDTQIGVSVKGSDNRLVSSLMDELKTVVWVSRVWIGVGGGKGSRCLCVCACAVFCSWINNGNIVD